MHESMYSLFGDFERLRREFDDLFDPSNLSAASIRSVAPGSFPALNVGNTPQSLEVYAFAPGIDPSRIEVTVDRGVLTLAGERSETAQARNAKVFSRERTRGSFRRAISLPEDADASKVEATYRDGVLQVSIARRAQPGPTRIAVQ